MDSKRHITSTLLILTFFVLNYLNAEEEAQNLTAIQRTQRLGIVRFENAVCTGYGSLQGTCYTRRQCKEVSGVASTNCASNIGVCCIISKTCGESSKINNTYLVSPGYPTTYSGGGVCTYTIEKIDSSVCQVRIDFLTLRLAQPNANGTCKTDALVVTGGGSIVPVLCGENSGQHMYVDFNGDTNIVISIGTSGSGITRAWNIRVSQINCNCPYKAPSGCLQYYTSSTGTVTSFNYGQAAPQNGTRQLANQNYGVCVAMLPGYCGIEWSETDTMSFAVSNDTYTYLENGDIGTINAEQFGNNCTTDFVVIPSPVFSNSTAVNTDRFCGNGFATVSSSSKPFVLTVVTNSNEVNDTGNVGFSLDFSQSRCSIINTIN